MQSIDTCKWLEYLLYIVVRKMLYQTVQKSNNKIVSNKAPEYDY